MKTISLKYEGLTFACSSPETASVNVAGVGLVRKGQVIEVDEERAEDLMKKPSHIFTPVGPEPKSRKGKSAPVEETP
jgi:hypothetical protein